MDTHQKFYKTSQRPQTLSERVKKDRSRQILTRKNKFYANRHIDLNESVSTPPKPVPKKLSTIRDKTTRLKTYIEQKRTAKLKEKIEERSPFVPYVPVGRWLPKPERAHKPKTFVVTTPVRKALMSDGKILKKSTIKEIAKATTTKKQIATIQQQKIDEPKQGKSKRKILGEINVKVEKSSVELPKPIFISSSSSSGSTVKSVSSDERLPSLNDTYELITDDLIQDDSVFETPVEDVKPIAIKEEKKKPVKKEQVDDFKEKKAVQKQVLTRAKIVVPVKPKQPEIVKKPSQSKREVKEKKKPAVSKENKNSVNSSSTESAIEEAPLPQKPASPPKPAKKTFSYTYKFYKSALDNQVTYITTQLKDVTMNIDSFINNLPEDTQTLVYQTIQQADLLVREKFKSFEDVLEKFEGADVADPKRITEEDVENYWTLLYDQIENFKENLIAIREAKKISSKGNKKRRTTRVFALAETPSRRSRRIAENGDTPKHSASCFGCTPLSSSKVNTPRSAKSASKRRTNFKKSIAFDKA